MRGPVQAPGGLGFWQVLTGILGPLADAGTSAYSTYVQQDLAKKETKAQRAEVQAALALRQREAELEAQRAAEEARYRAEQAPLRAQTIQIALGAGAVVGAAAILAWAVKRAGRAPARSYRGR
jgi:hypothetical protein